MRRSLRNLTAWVRCLDPADCVGRSGGGKLVDKVEKRVSVESARAPG